ncbi:MAG: hypothetical protein AAF926_08575 [Pseudomonadota bacterium]
MALIASGCSTVDRGTIDHVRIDTVPQGASVTVITDDRIYKRKPQRKWLYEHPVKTVSCAATPCALEINRNDSALVRVEADGYATVEYMVMPSSLRGGVGMDVGKTALTSGGVGAYIGYGIGSFSDAFRLSPLLTGQESIVGATTTGFTLAFSGMALATDIGNAANKNLFPNPVVLKLAPSGTEPPEDPLIDGFKAMLKTQNVQGRLCKQARKDRSLRRDCDQARVGTRRQMQIFETLRRKREREIRDAFKEQQEASNAG